MSRGGRGGGGGGRGRGGKPSIFTPQLLGGLQFNDIIAQSKEGDVAYPPMDLPQTEWPSTTESDIARTYNTLTSEIKFSPFWIDPPTKATSDIERYSDRYKNGRNASNPAKALADLHAQREYNKNLLPPALFDAILEKKSKRKSFRDGASKRKKIKLTDLDDGDDVDPEAKEGDDSQSDLEDVPDGLEEEEDYEDENDYADNYFDNGEDEDGGGDALGGGGDEDGGTFD